MGIYLKMSLAYLRKKKLRTSLLILGVALGVVLIFGTSVINKSKYKNDVEAINKLYGGYHLEFKDLNSDGNEKLKNDKDVSKTTTVQNLGNIVDEKGNSFPLRSANKDYVANKSGKLTKGRLPNNNNEIVMEENTLEAMDISDKLNTTLDFTIKKKYKDDEGNNKVYTVDKKFKLVGVIKKPEGFYDFYDINIPFEAFTYGNDEKNNIIPPDIITYDNLLSLKSGSQNPDGQAHKIMAKHNLGEASYSPNMPLVRQLMDKKIDRENPEAYKREVLIIITAAIFVFNIFNITLNETIKEMGLLRLIGASKKKVRCMIIYQALIIMALGIAVGLVLGVISSYIVVNTSNPFIYQEAVIKPKLYVSNENIMKAIITGVFSVFASCIIPIFKVGNVSSIEATKKTDKFKGYRGSYRVGKFLSKIFGFYGYMGFKNIGRNKSRALISMISIALGGYVFLTTFSSMKEEVSDKIENMQKRYDITIQFGVNSDIDNVVYTDSDVNKLKNIDGVKSVIPLQIESGLLDYKKNEMDKDFAKSKGIQEQEKMEYNMDVKLFGPDYIKHTLKNFLQEGHIYEIGSLSKGMPNVAVYNYFYDESKTNEFKKVFPDLKIGDTITIKVPTTEDGNTEYKESKVRVCAILKPDWMSKGDGDLARNFEIVTANSLSKHIVGEKKYNKLGINLEDTYDKTVNEKVRKVSNNIHLSQFESKLSFNEMMDSSAKEHTKSQLSIVVLVLIIAGINIFCTIKTNLLIRKKEIATLRAIGLSVKNMKKMVIYEALAYAILSFIITLIPSIMNLTKFVNWNNGAYKNYGIENFMSFIFPVEESIIFFVISVTVCLIAVATSSRDLKNMSIIEGIKDND
ncbi:ABC transporter permease [Romboutsia weinsteinii]|uniref:ABC transporter permease n=1 Tax=Romboutsia weinsteinii TaxID=2020949 RepID=A0A371J4X0_9FIRM|nr:FtsX-like permease family protein [Romboutsia weinsteinii]RDY27727.1 ABC transporter permease [Romboutsia weinsteinii]